MKKSTLAIIVVIVIIIAIAIFASTGKVSTENSIKNNTKNEIANMQTNEIKNTEVENIIENTENDENEVKNEVVENKEVTTGTTEENPKTEKERAIEIVKNDYKGSNEIEIAVEGMDENGNYIVTVRDSNTTEAYAFYNVNVTDGTFTKSEM